MGDTRDKTATINCDAWGDDLAYDKGCRILEELFRTGEIVYGIFGVERGSKTGTLHLQGFLQATERTGNAAWAKRMGKICGVLGHIETRRGTVQQARDYIATPEKYDKPPSRTIEVGVPDLDRGNKLGFRALVDALKKKQLTFNELKEQYTADYLIHERKFNSLQKLGEIPKLLKKKVYWLWGRTQTGKTENAYRVGCEGLDGVYFWNYGETLQAYRGEGTIILDDFRGELSYSFLLRLLDKYPMHISIKFGEARLLISHTIIITSDRHFKDLWEGEKDIFKSQLNRRITECICTNEPYTLN